MSEVSPLVGIVASDEEAFAVLAHTADTLNTLKVPFEKKALSAHYTPDDVQAYAEKAWERGLRVVVAGEKGAAHLAGMIKSFGGAIQVLAVLLTTEELRGLDSVASAIGMPAKVPVAIMGFDKPGAINAGVFAADSFVDKYPEIATAVAAYRQEYKDQVHASNKPS